MSAYRRDFEEINYISFLIKDNQLLEKYNEIWDEFSNIVKKGFDSEPVYNEKYLKTEINLMREKSIQIFIMIKCQKKVLIVFVYQWY